MVMVIMKAENGEGKQNGIWRQKEAAVKEE